MDVFEITGFRSAVSREGVNYLQPSDSFQNIRNGFVYRQVLQSRQGIGYFADRLSDESRVMGIFEHTKPDGSKDLLAFDLNFLYKYNAATNVFDQITFGGSMAAYTGFNIGANEFYISGTSYPTATNTERFVFCGEGITPNAAGSSVFFFDGTNVLDYTSVVDNTNYAAPPQGPLTRATYVLWFNNRINFMIPTINAITYNNGTLYSGFADAAGNGDKFNVAGSGLFQADTYQNMTGATILGQIMVHNYDRMAYVMEKTKDAFNPYFGRQVPGVLGTNAKFSAVSWNDTVRSIGRTGVLGTDGRQNLRVDNKIPYFTADEIDNPEFDQTYGGFDRLNNQFLWSYVNAGSESTTQNKILVGNYEENTWSFFDLRLSVFGQTDLGINVTWDQVDETSGNLSWAQWDTTEEIWNKIGLRESVQKTLAGDDLGFIYEFNTDNDDYFTTISAVATGATTTLTVAANGIQAGDLVTVANVEGMTQINNFNPATGEMVKDLYLVTVATPTSITVQVDSTLFDAYTPNTGTVSTPINFSAETIPFNPYRSEGYRCFVSHVEFYLDTNGGELFVDVYADQQETPFKRDVKLQTTSTNQAGEWITISVDQEANFITFNLKQNSPSAQVKITSIRIHCARGGLTSG
jgi:hypothetical protein